MSDGVDDALGLLRQMLRIRRFEEACAELYGAGKIRGFLHLYIGQEAVAAGAMPALRPDDSVLATYREHGHALMRGVPMNALMAEMYGKQEGCSHGRGGSMHVFDVARRFFGGSAIVGGALPLAAGFALAERYNGSDRLVACFFGEGAVAEGAFHETMNLAALWKLPLLFLCENNLYAMGTALDRSESDTDLCEKARSYRMPAVSVDGMDVLAVRQAVQTAADDVRKGTGPVFVELRTYRFRAHSMFDPELYRSRDEVAHWRERCPLAALERALRADRALDDARRAALERDVQQELADAIAFAEAGTWEPAAGLARDVYARAAAEAA